MEGISINSQPIMVSAPVSPVSYAESSEAPTVKAPTPAGEIRKDTPHAGNITQKEKTVDMEKLSKELNHIAAKENLDISFGYNEKIDKVFINIVDKSSGEVIRKLPSEEAIKFAEGMKELLGKLFDKKG
jgi:flagellar protein FlaG